MWKKKHRLLLITELDQLCMILNPFILQYV